MAASTERNEVPLAFVVQDRFGHDGTGGVARTEKENVVVWHRGSYAQHHEPQHGADAVVFVAVFGLTAYTLTLAAALFTSYFVSSSDSSVWRVAASCTGEQHPSSFIAGEQHPD